VKILLVEDDKPIAAVLSEVLAAQYYTVDTATDGDIGLQLATSWDYDLVLLDWLIPKLDGISLCRQLRAQGFQKPILLLTAKDSSTDVVKGLDAGADDYVTKPYDLPELLARMRALLRRRETSLAPNLLVWEHLCVNPVSAEVTYRGCPLSVSPKDYGLLGLFLRNPQRIFSRSDLIDRLWSIDASPSEGAVTNLIKDLRHKLKSAGMTADLFETVYGLGYRLKASPPEAGLADVPNTAERQKSQPLENGDRQKNLAGVNRVLERYKDTFAERVVLLEQAEQALRTGNLSKSLQQNASNEAHKLAGTLGSFGYATGSKLARSLEHFLNQSLTPAEAPDLAALIADIKQALAQPPIPISLESPVVSVEQPLVSVKQPVVSVEQPVVLVVDQDIAFVDRLKAQGGGLRIEYAVDLAQADKAAPNIVLLSLQDTAQATVEATARWLSKFRQQFSSVPVLVITNQDTLTDRVGVSRLGAQRFLRKPIAPAEVLEAIEAALQQSHRSVSPQVLPLAQTEARVMILDDDPVMLTMLEDLLQPWGLEVTSLQDPRQFWDVLVSTQPDLLMLDLQMPTYSGIDLCRVVRQDPQWGNLPILVVTAHTDRASVQQVFAAGADDFISKPIVGPELVTRVISRINRDRLQQELETLKRRIGL
jgi:DNA-binding response OmpR family regulator